MALKQMLLFVVVYLSYQAKEITKKVDDNKKVCNNIINDNKHNTK